MHPESLQHIPLVRHLLSDRRVRLTPRRVDKHWNYNGQTSVTVTGFNHFSGRVFYGEKSAFANWLLDPTGSARSLNEGDHLVQEVLFAVHDYLHVWALLAINELRPDLGIGVAPITQANVEDLAFCHLLTESCATVGLDYWYLSNIDLNQVVPLGTTLNNLTIDYHERHADEYRRFNPTFAAQDRSFFERIATFYCDGTFVGFDVADLKQSPRILRWLRHELRYGVLQRQYIRQWLSYLSGGVVGYDAQRLKLPLSTKEDWKRELIGMLGERLWEKVKYDRLVDQGSPLPDESIWKSPSSQRPDFRFFNVNHVEPQAVHDMAVWANADINFHMYFSQYLSTFDHASFDPALRDLIPALRERKDARMVQQMFRDQKSLPSREEMADLLILN